LALISENLSKKLPLLFFHNMKQMALAESLQILKWPLICSVGVFMVM